MRDADWIEWKGGECPVPMCELVTVRFRHEKKPDEKASAFNWPWQHSGNWSDIIAYKVEKPAAEPAPPVAQPAATAADVRMLWEAIDSLRARATVPEGWRLVPVEPTEGMVEMVLDGKFDINWGYWTTGEPSGPDDVYRAMIAAAPSYIPKGGDDK